jgi:hypothetical protein
MIIDFDFMVEKYNLNKPQIIDLIQKPNFQNNIQTYNIQFNKDFYENKYNLSFPTYFDAYADWMNKRKLGFKGFEFVENNITYYSFFDQDYMVINQLFNKYHNGFYIEISHFNNFDNSDTLTLYNHYNWNGLLITNNPDTINILKEKRPLDNIIFSVLNNNKKEFYVEKNNETLSNNSNNIKEIVKKIKIQTEPLYEVMKKHKCNKIIHFLTINVEENILDILDDNIFNNEYKILVCNITYYKLDVRNNIRDFFIRNNYKLYKELLLNDIFIINNFDSNNFIQTFEIFDNLIFRYFFNKDSIFRIIENELKIPNFMSIRKQAENGSTDLNSIYNLIGKNNPNIDCNAIKNMEIELDKKYMFTCSSNINKMKSKDIIFENTYYNNEEMREILRKFNIENEIEIGNDNKIIWNNLEKYFIISNYSGKQYINNNGIRNIKTRESELTNFEIFLVKNNFENIFFLLRYGRIMMSKNYNEKYSIMYLINLLLMELVHRFFIENKYEKLYITNSNLFNFYNILYNNGFEFIVNKKIIENENYEYKNYVKNLIFGKGLILNITDEINDIINYLEGNKIENMDYINFNFIENVKRANLFFLFNEKNMNILEINRDIRGNLIDYNNEPIFDYGYDKNNIEKLNLIKNHNNILHMKLNDEFIKNKLKFELEKMPIGLIKNFIIKLFNEI